MKGGFPFFFLGSKDGIMAPHTMQAVFDNGLCNKYEDEWLDGFACYEILKEE